MKDSKCGDGLVPVLAQIAKLPLELVELLWFASGRNCTELCYYFTSTWLYIKTSISKRTLLCKRFECWMFRGLWV